jgi:hypothetical protein
VGVKPCIRQLRSRQDRDPERRVIVAVKETSSATSAGKGVKEKGEDAVDLRALEEAGAEEPGGEISRGVTSKTAAELGMKLEVKVPPEAQAWMTKQNTRLTSRVEKYVDRVDAARSETALGLEAGAVTVGPYVGLDILAYSPIQSIGPPPYAPHKIIAGGEQATIWAALFVNPAVDIPNGFAIPATVQLSGRGFRVRCEQVDLTNLTGGPDFTYQAIFTSPAPSLTWIPFTFTAADPGVNPRLIEANITVDITDMAQPWAAFATWHFDIDSEPPFLWVPGGPSELQHDIPMRYLIYSES